MNTDMHAALLEWKAPSRITHKRTQGWYLCAGVVVLAMITYGILSNAWSFSITIAVMAGLFYLLRNEPHPLHTVRVMPLGIEFNGKLHPWGEWKDFWMLSSPDHCELHMETRHAFKRDLVVHTGDVDPYLIRDTISHYLPQNPHKREKMLDAIIRFCKI